MEKKDIFIMLLSILLVVSVVILVLKWTPEETSKSCQNATSCPACSINAKYCQNDSECEGFNEGCYSPYYLGLWTNDAVRHELFLRQMTQNTSLTCMCKNNLCVEKA